MPYQTASWRANTLRAYESLGSFGAKYCYLNKAKPKYFYSLITELTNGGRNYLDREDFTFDCRDFDFVKLSKLLDEPLSKVKKMSLSNINHLESLQRLTGYNLDSSKDFVYCPICMSCGYHSALHQIEWVSHCFIHNEKLLRVTHKSKSIPNIHDDIKLLGPIYDMWFGDSDIWASAKEFEWDLIEDKLIESKALHFTSALIEANSSMSKESLVIGDNPKSNLLLIVEASGKSNDVFRVMHQNKTMRIEKSFEYSCSPSVADQLLRLGKKGINLFMYSRRITCNSINAPQWKRTLDGLPLELQRNHSNCLLKYKETFYELEKLRVAWCGNHDYVHPPYDMQSYEKVPCHRIATLNLTQSLLSVEDNLFWKLQSHFDFYNFKEIVYLFKDIEDLNSLYHFQLASNWDGFIQVDNHLFLKKYIPGYILKPDEEPNFRRVRIPQPTGILETIIDHLLDALINTWEWALYETEVDCNTIENRRKQPIKYLQDKIYELTPPVVLRKTHDGIQIVFGKMAPYKRPKWGIQESNQKLHVMFVNKRTKELKIKFDWELADKMYKTELYGKRIAYMRAHDH